MLKNSSRINTITNMANREPMVKRMVFLMVYSWISIMADKISTPAHKTENPLSTK